MRCLALFTGGLDSLLSVRLVQEQGIEVVGVHVTNPLCAADSRSTAERAAQLGIALRTIDLAAEYCGLVRAPRFGRLESIAPCLDCRIATFGRARELLAETDARFVVSGEVVGQRRRTAIRDFEVVAHHAGLAGRLLRPLSAQLLPPSEPETQGWVDRSRCLSIQGKGRKTQLELASSLGLGNLPPPRPDCPLLAEPLSGRITELLADASAYAAWQLALAPLGRHFRIDQHTRIVVGRNREENDALRAAAARQAEAGACSLVTPRGFPGPLALVIGPATPAACQRAAELVVRYGRSNGSTAECVVIHESGSEETIIRHNPE